MFTLETETTKQEKEIAKQKKIDKMLKEYEENKEKQKSESKDADNLGLSMPKISYSKNWVNNEHLDRFLKCMSPAFAIIGVGGLFWCAGFAVSEISKAASFLKDVSLPESFTNIIATTAFWEVVGVVAAVCAVVFIIASIYSSVKNMRAENLQPSQSISQQISSPGIYQQVYQNYDYNANKDISNVNTTINKENYNTRQNDFNIPYKMEEKEQQYSSVLTNKNDKNKQEIFSNNTTRFNVAEKDTNLAKQYDAKTCYQHQKINKNI